ncbi:MAG: DUF255 domain-containing protein [Fimbriimonadaceae bacterium]
MTFLVTFWILVASVAYLLRPLIPDPEPNLLVNQPGDFVRAAQSQKLKWTLFGSQAFVEARRQDKPILLVTGTGWSKLGQRMDRFFETDDIVRKLNHDFICTRVDTIENPAWRSALLQFRRAEFAEDPTFGMYILTPTGKILLAPSSIQLWQVNDRGLLTMLKTALERKGSGEFDPAQEQQEESQFWVRGGSLAEPFDPSSYLEKMVSRMDPSSGGFRGQSHVRLYPQEWLLMYEMGDDENLAACISPVLQSPAVNLLDGGFFWDSDSTNWWNVNYSEVASANFDMLDLLANRAADGDDLSRILAKQLSYRIINQWGDGMPVYRDAFQADNRRSLTYSWTVNRLKSELTPLQQLRAESALGMDVKSNPQLSPYIRRVDAYLGQRDEIEKLLEVLRDNRQDGKVTVGDRHDLGVQARSVAAVFRAALLLEDQFLLGRATAEFHRLQDVMRIGLDDVYRRNFDGAVKPGDLMDYLAYAEMVLATQYFQPNSEVLKEGQAVLDRGVFLARESGGDLVLGNWKDLLPDGDPFTFPDLTDSYSRSAVSKVIHLLVEYGLMSRDPHTCLMNMARAEQWLERYSSSVDSLSLGAGGFARAANVFSHPFLVAIPQGAPSSVRSQFPRTTLVIPGGSEDGMYEVFSPNIEPKLVTLEEAVALARAN